MPEELSLGEPATDTTAPTASPFGDPDPAPGEAPPIEIPVVSIVDTILQLDDYLSGDVRRAEKTARFCSKPWLEADIDQLEFELTEMVDPDGNPLQGQEASAVAKAVELQTKQAEYGAAFVSVRLAQLPSDKWQEFLARTKDVRDKGAPYPNAFYDELIGLSAKTPVISAEQSAQLRVKLGDPQMDVLASAAWDVNTKSGVSIPKSRLSSHVLKRAVRSQS